MDAYCTVRDVRLALTPGADETNAETAANLEDFQLQDAIDEAQGIVDAHLLSRYQIIVFEIEEVNPEDPLETWVYEVAPAPVRGLTRDIAAYLAALTFRKNLDLEKDDPIRLRYAMAEAMLTLIRKGELDLTLPGVEGGDGGITVVNLYEPAMFTMEDVGLTNYPNSEYLLWVSARTAMI